MRLKVLQELCAVCFTTCVGFVIIKTHLALYLAHPVVTINYACIQGKKCIPILWCHYTEPGLLLLRNKGGKNKTLLS